MKSITQSRHFRLKFKAGFRKQNTDSAYDSVTYDQVKTALSELQAETEE